MSAALYMQVSEMAQNLMLIGYETSSSRVSVTEKSIVYRGFSGKIEYSTETGVARIIVGEQVVYDSSAHDQVVNHDQVVETVKRLNAEMMQVYEQQVLAGD